MRTSTRRGLRLLALVAIAAMLAFFGAQTAVAASVPVTVLSPSWTAAGGGGVWASYQGPPSYDYVSPGSVSRFMDRWAAPVKAGLTVDPADGIYEDQGLLAFKPGSVPVADFAAQPLTYDFVNEHGTNPVWVYIVLNRNLSDEVVYQYVPSTNPASWHTEDAAAGPHWQKWLDWSGTPAGPMVSLADIAAANPGKTVDRIYLTEGMGDSYHPDANGTVAWVDSVTVGANTYDFTVPTISAAAGAHGTISGPATVTAGDDAAFSIKPASGYYVSSLVVDGSAVAPTTSYTFSAVTGDHTIVAAFAALSPAETFDHNPALSEAQTPGAWYRDRFDPAGFANADFDGGERLKLSIAAADYQGAGSFYNTQGRDHDVPTVTVAAADLYVGADWATGTAGLSTTTDDANATRRSDLWVTARDSGGTVTGWPIIGFINGTGFRVFDAATGDWHDVGYPAGFSYGAWYNLRIQLTPGPTGMTSFYVNDQLVYVSHNSDDPDYMGQCVGFSNVMLQAKNFNNSYDVYWDNVVPVAPASAPHLSLPADVTTTTAGSTGSTADFMRATASDMLGNALMPSYTIGGVAAAPDHIFPIGTTTVDVTVGDAWGNVSAGSFKVNVNDVTAPQTTISALPSGWVNHDVAFSLTASDTDSPSGIVTSYRLTPPGVTVTSASGTVSAEGTTTIEYWSRDAAGNTEPSKTATVAIDKSAPTVPGTPEWSQLTTDSVDLYWPASTDSLSGVDHYVVLDGSTEVTQTGGTSVLIPIATETIHHYSVVAVDAVGNRSSASGNLTVDTPSAVVIMAPSRLTSGFNKTVTITVTLTNSRGVLLSKRPMALEENTNGSWVKVADLVPTKSKGTYSAKVARGSRSVFRARFLGDAEFAASASGDIVLLPQASLKVSAATRVKPGVTFHVTGTLLPAHAGTAYVTVEIQRKPVGLPWVAAASLQVAIPVGATSFDVATSLAKGSYRLRAVHSDSTHAYTATAYRSILIK